MSKLTLLLEAERRGIIDAPNAELLTEARRRGLVPAQKELSWSDVPGEALKNSGSSAMEFAKNVVTPFLEPVETAKGLYNLGKGVASKAAGLVVNQDPAEKAKTEAGADAVGKFFADRYGGMDNLKRTLAKDPVGVMADLSAVLTGGGTLAARGPGVVGQVGNAVRTAGSVIDPLANAGRAVAATGRGASHVLGMTTGTGSMPVQTAFQAGRQGGPAATAFTDAMRGNSPVSNVVDMAETAVNTLTNERGAAYRGGIGATLADQTVLNTGPIRKSIQDALNTITYQGQATNVAAARALNEVAQEVARFESLPNNAGRVAGGLDAMKKAVSGVMERYRPGTQEYRVTKLVYDAIGREIRTQVPSYDNVMRGYSQASDQLAELRRTFSINPNAAADTTARKLLSVTRNNVNTNYGERARLMDVLAQRQPTLPHAIAGHAMSSPTPRGLQSVAASGAGISGLSQFANPAVLATLPAFSPRVVGEASYAAGRGVNMVEQIARRLNVSTERARQILMSSYGVDALANAEAPGLLGNGQ